MINESIDYNMPKGDGKNGENVALENITKEIHWIQWIQIEKNFACVEW